MVLVLAAILGGVLGTLLDDSSDEPNSETTDQPSESTDQYSQEQYLPIDKTGTALLVPVSGASTLAYYCTKEGFMEFEFKTGFSTNDSVTTVIIATNAKSTSPLAAVEVRPPGSSTYRTVFYLDVDNLLNFVNATLNSSWSSPHIIFNDLIAEPNTRALSAIAGSGGTEALSGIRVYLGTSNGYVQEFGTDFGGSTSGNVVMQWYKWEQFRGSDPESGVASVMILDLVMESSKKIVLE
ncbi:hypothetical protein CBER1_11165 [Cercospora berteroae]|uniref:Uncharacterized protein n=1 Tax=Cercospora berteroae TaxID=357750 RepID=A0A2S6CEG0_9PEZI|nr:hypothetical protein CBER1_11165 [Cercospora berteroae]